MLKINMNLEEVNPIGDVLLSDEMYLMGSEMGDIWQQEKTITPLEFNPVTASTTAANLFGQHQQTPSELSQLGNAFESFLSPSEDKKSQPPLLISAAGHQTPRASVNRNSLNNPLHHHSISPQAKCSTPKVRGKHAICQVPECNRRVRSRGFCKAHGGGRKCTISGCNKSSQNGEFCIGHGGGKKCKKENCSKAAQSHGLCKAHGGGARCKFVGCSKSSQGGGLCRAHGGGKRCQATGCPKGAQRGNFCATHGGFRSCKIEECVRTDRGGGYCEVHRRDKLCKVKGCKKLSRNLGMCTMHIRECRDPELSSSSDN